MPAESKKVHFKDLIEEMRLETSGKSWFEIEEKENASIHYDTKSTCTYDSKCGSSIGKK